jgi:hypothetical protein
MAMTKEALEKQREYRKRNPQVSKKYYENNKDKYAENRKRWRKENPMQYQEQWKTSKASQYKRMAEDIDVFTKYQLTSLKSGASRRGIAFNLNFTQLKNLFLSNTTCALSGVKLTFNAKNKSKASIDRINSKHGYSIKNCQVVSAQINKHKLNLTDNEFITLCKAVTKHSKKK